MSNWTNFGSNIDAIKIVVDGFSVNLSITGSIIAMNPSDEQILAAKPVSN